MPDRRYRFPWGTYSKTMPWWSSDPKVLTWCRFLHDWEDDYSRTQEEIAKAYGIKPRWGRYVFARWERFRRGKEVMPRLDPLAAMMRTRIEKENG